jgi:molecular chaperone GrpE
MSPKNQNLTKLKTLEDNWKRALADYKNLERRIETEKQSFAKLASANLIARLLPSLDILELAASHSQDMGIQLAAKQFHQALKDEGLEIIDPQPEASFDHHLHECAETVDIMDGKVENTISELVLKGYKIGDYVLRPARVKVYKKPETDTKN